MSTNRKYALGLTTELKKLTAAGIIGAAEHSLRAAIRGTVQDSGQAAFNWKFSVNNAYERQRLLYRKGVSPVGNRGDKGGNSSVIEADRVSALTSAMRAIPEGELKSVLIYHPLPEGSDYAIKAGIAQAAVAAGNAGALDAVAAKEMRKNKSGSGY